MIAVASTSVDCTITGLSEFGSMCRNTIAFFFTPSAVAANTWSLCRCASIEPLSNRANTGICTIETARITVNWLGFANIAAIENASSSDGSESMTSTMRMTTESTQPPSAPASVPRINPPARPIRVAPTPTINVCCEPTSRRDRKSRPCRSPPSGWPGCGGGISLRALTTCSISIGSDGLCGASHGESSESATKMPMIVAPMRNTGLRRSLFHALAASETPADSARPSIFSFLVTPSATALTSS